MEVAPGRVVGTVLDVEAQQCGAGILEQIVGEVAAHHHAAPGGRIGAAHAAAPQQLAQDPARRLALARFNERLGNARAQAGSCRGRQLRRQRTAASGNRRPPALQRIHVEQPLFPAQPRFRARWLWLVALEQHGGQLQRAAANDVVDALEIVDGRCGRGFGAGGDTRSRRAGASLLRGAPGQHRRQGEHADGEWSTPAHATPPPGRMRGPGRAHAAKAVRSVAVRSSP